MKTRLTSFFIVLLFLCFSFLGAAQTFSTNVGANIPDNTPTGVDIPLNISGLPNIDCSFGLDQICFDITHTFTGDLDIFLVSPGGTIVELLTDIGGNDDNFASTCLDMSSGNNIDGSDDPYTGVFAPEAGNDFGTFNSGVDPNGTWNLRVIDDAGADVGAVNSFSLTFALGAECTIPPPVLNNDAPCDANPLSVQPANNCSPTVGITTGAGTELPTPPCIAFTPLDVWYTAVIPASGSMNIATSNNPVGTSDPAIALYTYDGTGAPVCDNLMMVACSDHSYNNPNYAGLNYAGTPGEVVYIRVMSFSLSAGTFSICLKENDACGQPNDGTNDFCQSAQYIAPGPGFSNSTDNYTRDTDEPLLFNPVDLDIQGWNTSVENNAWYIFTATAATMTFAFSGVSCATAGDGIQAIVFDVTYDANGCCVGFTSMTQTTGPVLQNDGGWTPLPGSTGGSFDAVGLTPGQNYVLMIDGWAGSNCDYTIDGWEETVNPLPVELLSFDVLKQAHENLLVWTTAAEVNNDYFVLERSFDAINFDEIGTVDGAGNSQGEIDYSFSDRDVRTGMTYYRLKQVDFDGTMHYSDLRAVSREHTSAFAYPNPTSGKLNIYLGDIKASHLELHMLTADGRLLIERFGSSHGNVITSEKFAYLAAGMYTVQLFAEDGSELLLTKVAKH